MKTVLVNIEFSLSANMKQQRAYISFRQTPSVKSVTRPLCMRQRAKENHKAEIQEETFNTTVAISKSIERTCYSGFSPIRNSKWWSGSVSVCWIHIVMVWGCHPEKVHRYQGTSRGVKANLCREFHFILFVELVVWNWTCSRKKHSIK
jgi:hypothetical protein